MRKIGDAAGDEVADDLPHRAAAARVEAGGRLVEEDDPRVADERHREVEPAAHAAGVGGRRLVGRVDEVEPLEQLGGAPAALGAAEVVQVGHQDQVLRAGEQVVDGRELAGDADRGAHRVGVARRGRGRRRARSPPSAPIRVERIWTIVVLPAPFGPSSAKTVPSATSRSTPSSTTWSP